MKKGTLELRNVNGGRTLVRAAAALALAGLTTGALADPPLTMAPPMEPTLSQTADGQFGDSAVASQDSVFRWQEVPANQSVPLQRAVFDQGGYQLYDTAGETIVVPFSNNNLYVMKFGLSKDGTTYFVNEGDAPVLYVPRNGYLENASVPGARWFPFPEDFRPEQPVFLGIAPSWHDYCAMGWYPDMVFYGGYWGAHPYFAGSVFAASFGLSIFIGGHHYDGWEPYHHYYAYHPAPYHVTIVDRNVYRFGGRPGGGHEYFRGAGHQAFVDRGFGGGRHFGGVTRDSEGARGLSETRGLGGGHVFNGTGRPYYAHRDLPGGRNFDGLRATAPNGVHSFGGARPSGEAPAFGGGRTFQGSHGSFSESSGHYPTGGGHTFAGGGHFDGPRVASHDGHSSGEGGRPSGANPNSAGRSGRSSGTHGDDHDGRH